MVDLNSTNVLDLFAGTGNISFEFISRGAASVTAVDREKKCLEFIRTVKEKLDAQAIRTVRSDIYSFIKRETGSYNIIFADPPFDMENKHDLAEMVLNSGMLKDEGIFILEHPEQEAYDNIPGFSSSRKYGNVTFSFFVLPLD